MESAQPKGFACRMDAWVDASTYRWMGGWMHMYLQIGRQTDRWIDKQFTSMCLCKL